MGNICSLCGDKTTAEVIDLNTGKNICLSCMLTETNKPQPKPETSLIPTIAGAELSMLIRPPSEEHDDDNHDKK